MSLLTSRLVCGIPASSGAFLAAEFVPIGRSAVSISLSAAAQRNCSVSALLSSRPPSSSASSSSSFCTSSSCYGSVSSAFKFVRSSSAAVSGSPLLRSLFSTQTNGKEQSHTPGTQSAEAENQQTAEQKTSNGGEGVKEAAAEFEKLKLELAKVQEQLDACRRFAADLDNQRKRALEEAKKERMFAIQGFAKALLDVADTLEFALKDGRAAQDKESETFKNVVQGIEMTLKNLEKAFEKGGVKKVTPLNETFDPHRHEAIVQLENAHVPPNTVIEVFKCGYTINERTLRAAQVATSKKPATPQPQP